MITTTTEVLTVFHYKMEKEVTVNEFQFIFQLCVLLLNLWNVVSAYVYHIDKSFYIISCYSMSFCYRA